MKRLLTTDLLQGVWGFLVEAGWHGNLVLVAMGTLQLIVIVAMGTLQLMMMVGGYRGCYGVWKSLLPRNLKVCLNIYRLSLTQKQLKTI